MRALLDANIYISYLLAPDKPSSAAVAVVESALAGAFTVIMPTEVANEITNAVEARPYLVKRIPIADAAALVRLIESVAETAAALEEPPTPVVRNPGDDYLIAQASRANVDVVVTRNKDLLDLEQHDGILFMSPAAFLSLLRADAKPEASLG